MHTVRLSTAHLFLYTFTGIRSVRPEITTAERTATHQAVRSHKSLNRLLVIRLFFTLRAMWPGGWRRLSALQFNLLPLLLLLLLLAPVAHGAVTARPAAWRPIYEQSGHQVVDGRPHVTAAGDRAVSQSADIDQHTAQHSGQHDQHSAQHSSSPQHGPRPQDRWPATIPSHLINWEHPGLQGGGGGGVTPLKPALSLSTLAGGSQETSDVIRAITQYQLVR